MRALRFSRACSVVPCFGAGVLLLALAAPAPAQSVRGRLLEQGTEAPVAGASVVLVDSAGAERGGVLSDSTGSFLLRAPGPGSFALRVQRIGFAAVSSPPLPLARGEVVDLELRLRGEAVPLDPVQVTVRSRRDDHQRVLGLDPRTVGGYVVPAERIAAWRNTSRHTGDLLRKMNIPGLTVRDDIAGPSSRGRGGGGQFPMLCVELGRARGGGTRCRMVRVYLNDAPLPDPHFALLTLGASSIDRLVLLRPHEAGVLFGTGSSDGVLLIYTRGRDGR